MGWVLSVTPRPRFIPGERTPGPVGLEIGWAPQPVSRQRLDEKSSSLWGGSNPDRPVVQSVLKPCIDWATRLPIRTMATTTKIHRFTNAKCAYMHFEYSFCDGNSFLHWGNVRMDIRLGDYLTDVYLKGLVVFWENQALSWPTCWPWATQCARWYTITHRPPQRPRVLRLWLRSFGRWDRGFESCSSDGCLSSSLNHHHPLVVLSSTLYSLVTEKSS
jgi:hypothetical protein